MEYENNKWYIEVKYDDFQEYTGDTSNFWHILNDFDEIKPEQSTEIETETEEPETVTIEPNN